MEDKSMQGAAGVAKPDFLLSSPNNDAKKPESELNGNGLESGTSRPPSPVTSGFPDNCAEVVRGIYRSSFILPAHISSIELLGIKTIVTLVNEEWSNEYKEFVKNNGITSHIIPITANKDPDIYTPESTVAKVLEILLDTDNHPVLVHCNKGRHRTGCIMACFRKAQGWSVLAALTEYLYYAWPKARLLDRNYILSFNESIVADRVKEVNATEWLPTIPVARPAFDGAGDEKYYIGSTNGKKSKSETALPPTVSDTTELRKLNSV